MPFRVPSERLQSLFRAFQLGISMFPAGQVLRRKGRAIKGRSGAICPGNVCGSALFRFSQRDIHAQCLPAVPTGARRGCLADRVR